MKGKHLINETITHPSVRLIGEDGKQYGIVTLAEANRIARDLSLDLVEISGESVPPVCKVLDYSRFLYDEKKHRAKMRKNIKQSVLKEVVLRPSTGEADYQVKLKNVLRFLAEGNKAKVSVRFRGREITHAELGQELMQKVILDVGIHGKIDSEAKLEGKMLSVTFSPVKATVRH